MRRAARDAQIRTLRPKKLQSSNPATQPVISDQEDLQQEYDLLIPVPVSLTSVHLIIDFRLCERKARDNVLRFESLLAMRFEPSLKISTLNNAFQK